MQRRGGETVPGCFGRDETDEDYCVWPTGYNASKVQSDMEDIVIPTKWDNGFCLKLYWWESLSYSSLICLLAKLSQANRCNHREQGYNWQNETFERKCKLQRSSMHGGLTKSKHSSHFRVHLSRLRWVPWDWKVLAWRRADWLWSQWTLCERM